MCSRAHKYVAMHEPCGHCRCSCLLCVYATLGCSFSLRAVKHALNGLWLSAALGFTGPFLSSIPSLGLCRRRPLRWLRLQLHWTPSWWRWRSSARYRHHIITSLWGSMFNSSDALQRIRHPWTKLLETCWRTRQSRHQQLSGCFCCQRSGYFSRLVGAALQWGWPPRAVPKQTNQRAIRLRAGLSSFLRSFRAKG